MSARRPLNAPVPPVGRGSLAKRAGPLRTRGPRPLAGLLALALAFLITACDAPEQGAAGNQGPPEVTVASPRRERITEWDEYTGRFAAIRSVEVRARVTGYIERVAFEDGQRVATGDLLFVIDQRPFRYALQRAEAQHALAVKEYERAESLLASRSIPQEEFDRRLQEVNITEASLLQARLDLEFTEVRSPIDGKASRDLNNVGNLVLANETVLTNIVSLDPIHFYFDASQVDLLKYVRFDRSGQRPSSDTAPNEVQLRLPDEEGFPHQGVMDFVDNRVDESTGTIQGRAVVPNPDAVIYPGMFGRARLIGRKDVEVLTVPAAALNTDQSRRFVYVVNQEGQAVRRYLSLGRLLEGERQVVTDGLDGEERVVVAGIQRIRAPRQPVTAVRQDDG